MTFGLFRNTSILIKNCLGYFLVDFWIYLGYFLFQHLVTLIASSLARYDAASPLAPLPASSSSSSSCLYRNYVRVKDPFQTFFVSGRLCLKSGPLCAKDISSLISLLARWKKIANWRKQKIANLKMPKFDPTSEWEALEWRGIVGPYHCAQMLE